jgi:hypothetical protein
MHSTFSRVYNSSLESASSSRANRSELVQTKAKLQEAIALQALLKAENEHLKRRRAAEMLQEATRESKQDNRKHKIPAQPASARSSPAVIKGVTVSSPAVARPVTPAAQSQSDNSNASVAITSPPLYSLRASNSYFEDEELQSSYKRRGLQEDAAITAQAAAIEVAAKIKAEIAQKAAETELLRICYEKEAIAKSNYDRKMRQEELDAEHRCRKHRDRKAKAAEDREEQDIEYNRREHERKSRAAEERERLDHQFGMDSILERMRVANAERLDRAVADNRIAVMRAQSQYSISLSNFLVPQ